MSAIDRPTPYPLRSHPTRSAAVVLGTRPEIIKLAGIIGLLGSAARVIHTGQHYDAGLSDVFFDAFGLQHPTEYLGIGGKTRGEQIGLGVAALDAAFAADRPQIVIAQGDTNSVAAAALAANAREIPFAHVEAGLRSFDRAMPEEHNRVIADHLSDLCLAPTVVAKANLANEGIADERIVVTGNTIVEAVETLLPLPERRSALLGEYGVTAGAYVLSTLHRPENVDDPAALSRVLAGLGKIGIPVLLPLHPRTRSRMTAYDIGAPGNLVIVDPIPYQDFLGLLAECAMAVADSGGVQEEVSVVKRPMLVVRRSTERPEVVGTFSELVSAENLPEMARGWLERINERHAELEGLPTPYGDGTASERSIRALARLAGDSL